MLKPVLVYAERLDGCYPMLFQQLIGRRVTQLNIIVIHILISYVFTQKRNYIILNLTQSLRLKTRIAHYIANLLAISYPIKQVDLDLDYIVLKLFCELVIIFADNYWSLTRFKERLLIVIAIFGHSYHRSARCHCN